MITLNVIKKLRSNILAIWFAFFFFGFNFQLVFFEFFIGVDHNASIVYRALILAGSIFLIVSVVLKIRIGNDYFLMAVLIFYFLYSLSLTRSLVFGDNPLGLDDEVYIMMFYGVCAIPALSVVAINNVDSLKFMKISIYLLGSTCVFSLLLFDFNDLIIKRLATEKINPISISHVGVSLIIISLVYYKECLHKNLIPWVLILVGLGVVIISQSRGPIVSLIFVVYLFIFKQSRFSTFLIVLIVSLSLSVYGFNFLIEQEGFSRLYETGESTSLRVQSFQGAINQFFESPLLGSHIEEHTTRQYPHNIVIEAFMSTGVFGGVLLMGIIISSLRASLLGRKKEGIQLAASLLYMQYIISAMFSGAIFTNNMFWYLSIMVLIVVKRKSYVKH